MAKTLIKEFMDTHGTDLKPVDKKVLQLLMKDVLVPTEEQDEPEHALFSPSASKQWLNCPGSLEMEEDIEEETSFAAEEGTFYHNLMEELFLGASLEYVLEKAKNDTMRDAILFAHETVNNFPEVVFFAEQKVHLTEDCWGTADLVLWDKANKSLRILDFKYGLYPVDAEDNTQLQIYAAGVFKLWKELGIVPESVWGTIIQPRSRDGKYVKSAQFKRAELVTIEARVKLAEKLHKSGEAKLTAGKHCIFCMGKAICPAYFQHQVEDIHDFFHEPFYNFPADAFDIDEASERLYKLQQYSVWQKNATSYIKQQLLDGEFASHHYLTSGGQIRQKDLG